MDIQAKIEELTKQRDIIQARLDELTRPDIQGFLLETAEEIRAVGVQPEHVIRCVIAWEQYNAEMAESEGETENPPA